MPATPRLHVAERGRASNWIYSASRRTTAGGTRKTNLVPTVTLDDLLDQGPAPDIIKMDIEGAEIMALQGGKRLLAEARPVFYVEVGHEQSDAVGRILTDAGYHLHDGDAPAGSRPRLDHCAKNTLAIPSERSNENQN